MSCWMTASNRQIPLDLTKLPVFLHNMPQNTAEIINGSFSLSLKKMSEMEENQEKIPAVLAILDFSVWLINMTRCNRRRQ